VRNKNTREVPWFRFGVRWSEAKPIFSLGSLFRLGIYSSLVLCCNFLEIKISLGSNFRGFLYVIQLKTSLSWIFHPAHFFAQLIFSLGSYFRGFYFRGFSNPRKFKHSEVFDVYSNCMFRICTSFVCLRAQLTLLVRSERVYTVRTFGLNDENFCHFRTTTRTSATFRNI